MRVCALIDTGTRGCLRVVAAAQFTVAGSHEACAGDPLEAGRPGERHAGGWRKAEQRQRREESAPRERGERQESRNRACG